MNSALTDCNIVVSTVQELSDCTIAQEVEDIQAPEVIGVICFEGSAIFIAPALRNAILASNTQEPFKLIPLMTATTRALDAAHVNNGNMQEMAITHTEDLNAWSYGIKCGLIPEIRYFVIPDEKEVADFFHRLAPSMHQNAGQGLAQGGGVPVDNDAILRQLIAAIAVQNKAATESNDLHQDKIQRQQNKEEN